MNWEQLCQLGCKLPEVSIETWYRTPALKVRGKGFCRLKEDGKTVVFFLDSVDQQELLIQAQPELYFITDHYRGWPAVLARLSQLEVAEAQQRLKQGWRLKAPKKLQQAFKA